MHYTILDYYRFFAAFLVSISHYLFFHYGSDFYEFTAILGVELFFVLSGFVLTPQLKLIENGPIINIKTFILRRWYRTLPSYFFALIAAAVVFDYGSVINIIKFLTYTQNILADNSNPNFFPVAWSLSVEEWFYIILPCLIFLLNFKKISNQSLLKICLIIILVLSVLKTYTLINTDNWGEEVRRSVLFRLDALCWGVLGYLYKNIISRKIINIIFFLGIVIIGIFYFQINKLNSNLIYQFLYFPVCSVTFTCLLILLSKIEIVSPKLNYLGKFLASVSYSMYLFHIFFISMIIGKFESLFYSLLLYLVSLIIFCNIFFNFFEKPILKLRPNYVTKKDHI